MNAASHPIDLYVYYQVQDADAALLQARIKALQLMLAQQYNVAGQLKQRPSADHGRPTGVQTWMEVYTATPRGFAAALELAVQQADLMRWTVGARHTEIFTDVIPCA